MHIGVLTLELHIHGAQSLKDKRAVVNSLLERMRGRFNVSAAQLDEHDRWQRATLAIAVVSNSQSVANGVLNHVRDLAETETRCDITECSMEFV